MKTKNIRLLLLTRILSTLFSSGQPLGPPSNRSAGCFFFSPRRCKVMLHQWGNKHSVWLTRCSWVPGHLCPVRKWIRTARVKETKKKRISLLSVTWSTYSLREIILKSTGGERKIKWNGNNWSSAKWLSVHESVCRVSNVLHDTPSAVLSVSELSLSLSVSFFFSRVLKYLLNAVHSVVKKVHSNWLKFLRSRWKCVYKKKSSSRK